MIRGLTIVLAGLIACAIAAAAAPPLADGGPEALWCVSRSGEGDRCKLWRLSASRAEAGQLEHATVFPTMPIAIAARRDTATLLFPPADRSGDGPPAWILREVSVDLEDARHVLFTAPKPLPPLVTVFKLVLRSRAMPETGCPKSQK